MLSPDLEGSCVVLLQETWTKTLSFDFRQYLNPWYLLPFSQSCVLCGLGGSSQIGECLGCLFMSQPRLGATWACPCSAEPELCSPAQQHGRVSLCFVFRLKVFLALELELAHVWSALEQMCGCLRSWESVCPSRGQHLEAVSSHLLHSKEQGLF